MEFNFWNLLIMTGDFNIYNSLWDPSYIHHSFISDNLFVIANSFNLSLSYSTDHIPTRYSDNANNSNLVINLMFLHSDSSELNTHIIYPEWCLTSDYTLLTITKEYINTRKRTITKNSKENDIFIKEVIVSFAKLDTSSISNISNLEKVILDFADIVHCTWIKYLKLINITRHSKSWWNDKCNSDLVSYRSSKSIKSWKTFWKTVKNMKREFFNLKIQEIVSKKRGP